MNKPDIRWKHRFSNFKKALGQLQEFVDKKNLSKLERQGLIKSFEYTYELAWNTMKDFYEAQGESGMQGSKDAIRLAFRRGLISDGDTWMRMVQSRIDTAHGYDEKTADKVADFILEQYFQRFVQLRDRLEQVP